MLDGVGIGELPDAQAYGDRGSNTLGNIASRIPLKVPTLRALGLGRVAAIGSPSPMEPREGAVGRMAEASPGKDSVTGHWELMGIVLDRPFPVFPDGFPADVLAEFSRRTGRPVLGNTVASGTNIIAAVGAEHLHGVRDEASTRALIAQENRRYARRQLIWFRKEPNLVWLDGPGETPTTIAAAKRLVEARLPPSREASADRRSLGGGGQEIDR